MCPLSLSFKFYFLCMTVLSTCMFLYIKCVPNPQRPEEGVGSPETGVIGGCEPPRWYWERDPSPLQEPAVFQLLSPSSALLGFLALEKQPAGSHIFNFPYTLLSWTCVADGVSGFPLSSDVQSVLLFLRI